MDINPEQFRKYREMEYRDLLVEFIKLLRPRVYCEIGVKRGYTFKAVMRFIDRCIGVDPVKFKNADQFNSIEFYEMTSQEFAEIYEGPKFDMLFIDGDHSSITVNHDVIKIGVKFIQPYTGLIFLHDTYPSNPDLEKPGYCDDAWRAAQVYHREGHLIGLESVTIPGPWAGLSILRYVPDSKKFIHWR